MTVHKMKTLVIVVTYNRLELLKQCIQALKNQTNEEFDILVVDNAGTDGTQAYMQSLCDEQIIYKRLSENIGGAGGFHYGMQYAVEHAYTYCWAMDDDTLPKSEAYQEFINADALLGGNYGWLSSQCLWQDDKLQTMNLQRKNPYQAITDLKSFLVKAEMASFVSLFIPTRVVEDVGLPIQEFFIWVDDWEYTRRISQKYACYVVNKSKVVHAIQENKILTIATDREERLSRYQYFYRNDVYLYRREGVKGWCWLLAKDVWHSVKVIKSHKQVWKKLCIIWTGMVQGISFRPSIEYARRTL